MAEETVSTPEQTSTGTATFPQDEVVKTEVEAKPAAADDTATKLVEDKPVDSATEVAPVDGEVKPEAEVKPDEAKPLDGDVKYDLKPTPDGVIDQARVDEVIKMGKEHKLSEAQLKDLLTVEHAAVARFNQAQAKKTSEERAAWKAQLESDKSIGGEKLTETLSHRDKALNFFAPQEFIQELRSQGLDNYPPLVKMLSKIGKDMESRPWVNPDNVNSKPKTYEEIFYPGNKTN